MTESIWRKGICEYMKNKGGIIHISKYKNYAKSKISIYNVCFTILLIASIMSNAFTTIYNGVFSHLASYTYHVLIPVLFVIALIDTYKNGSKKKDVFLLFSLAFIIIIGFLSRYTSIYDKYTVFVATVCFFEMIIIIFVSSKFKATHGMINCIFISNILIAVSYIIESKLSFAYYYISKGQVINFGLNPNLAGMLLMVNAEILYIALFYYKNWKVRVLFFSIFFYMVYLIAMTHSRTSMIGIGLLILFGLKKKIKITRPRVILVTLIPAFFPITYLLMEALPYFRNMTLFVKYFYSGRDAIYLRAFQDIKNWFLIGDFRYKFSNAHNGPLAICLTIGILGFIIYYLYLWLELLHLRKGIPNVKSKVRINLQTVSYIAVITLFIHACTEAAFFVFGQQLAVSVCSLYFLAGINQENPD